MDTTTVNQVYGNERQVGIFKTKLVNGINLKMKLNESNSSRHLSMVDLSYDFLNGKQV